MANSNGTNGNGRKRVVITGMGTLNPLGNTVDEFWEAALAGQVWRRLAHAGRFHRLRRPHRRRGQGLRAGGLHRPQGGAPDVALLAARARRRRREAFATSRSSISAKEDPYRVGVLFGNGMGGYPDTDKAVKDITQKGVRRMDPFYMVKMLPNMAAAQVAMQYGAKGYNATISTACASAGNAMGEAMEMIRAGRADVMITGGTEAGLSELGLAAFQIMKALSTSNDPPQAASRPFDAKRDGFVSSEGAAVFVIESLEHAQARGAPILAELAGYGCTSDAHHVVVPVEDGETTAMCMTLGARPTPA